MGKPLAKMMADFIAYLSGSWLRCSVLNGKSRKVYKRLGVLQFGPPVVHLVGCPDRNMLKTTKHHVPLLPLDRVCHMLPGERTVEPQRHRFDISGHRFVSKSRGAENFW